MILQPLTWTLTLACLAIVVHQSKVVGQDVKHDFIVPEATIDVKEDSPIGTSVFTASTTSEDAPQMFSFDKGDVESFMIDSRTGLVTLAAPLDCEAKSTHVMKILSILDPRTVSTTYPGSTTTLQPPVTAISTLTVNVTDVNDNAPVFVKSNYAVSIRVGQPRGIQLVTVTAADADCTPANSEISYSLFGDPFAFEIDAASGTVSLRADVTTGEYQLSAVAEDPGGLQNTAGITVTVFSDCGPPPVIQNGTVELAITNDTSYGSIAEVTCEAGFEPLDPLIECTVHGQWDTAQCIPKLCTDLDSPLNGTVSYSSDTADLPVGTTATFQCDAGFNLIGNATVDCLTSGNWSAREPECKIKDCGTPPKLNNGTVKTDTGNTLFGSKALFTCNPGYTLSGSNTSACLHNATWEQEVPTCVIKDCGIVPAPDNSVVSYINGTVYRAVALFSCNTGFNKSNRNNLTCTADGEWSGTAPNCTLKACTRINASSQGYVNFTANVTTVGSNATFSCKPGYKLSHTNVLTCNVSGLWSKPIPSCDIKECARIDAPSQGSVSFTGNETTYGSNATFSCKLGYTLSHTDTLTCTAAGDWNGTPPTCNITECVRIDAPSQGFVSFTGNATTYGSNATFSCKPGYTLSHTDTLTCTAAGDWNGTPPTCNITECARIDAPNQGSVSFTGNATTYGSNATFSCKPGYTLSHTDTLTCTAAGNWNGNPPTCNITECARIDAPNQGSVSFTGNETTYGSNATFSCKLGYTLSHTDTLTCTAAGDWNGTPPTCNITECVRIDAPSQGFVSFTGNATTYGSNATFSCKPGYTLSHTDTLTCTAAGDWNGTPPTCNITECARIDAPNQGSVSFTGNATTYGSNATFSCKPGYTLSHTDTLTCTAAGNWNGNPPTCNITECARIDAPNQGSVSFTGNETTYGSNATFSCKLGYTLSHTDTLTCTAAGDWNGTPPTCNITECVRIDAPSQGFVSFTGNATTYGSNATFSCKPGYTLSHTDTLTCTAAGDWNGTPPTCNITECARIDAPNQGSVSFTGNATTYGSNATFSCKPGYTLSHTDTLTCTAAGNWNGNPPTCNITECARIDAPNQGSVSFTGNATTYGSNATFSCKPGYTLSHTDTLTCTAAGDWNGTPPTCNITECVRIDAPSQGFVSFTGNATTYGSNATFSCKPGYTLSHTDTLTCTAAGDWNGTPPTCDITECVRIDAPSQGFVSFTGNATTYGSNATFSCKPGYTLSHTDTLACTAAGDWNGTPPTCDIKECVRIDAPSQGFVSFTGNATTYGSNATFSCKPGYTLSHTDKLTCTAAGDWNGTPPTCDITECVRIDAPSQGFVSFTGNATLYGSNVTFSCKPGYTLSHTDTLTCTAAGDWNGTPPTCDITECVRIDAPSQGFVSFTGNATTYGSNATFSCKPGYTLSHTDTLTCTAAGDWNGNPPTCDITECVRIDAPSKGFVSFTGNATTYGSYATFSCKPGYTLSHTDTLTCTAAGDWNETPPTCDITECVRIDAPSQGFVSFTGNATTYGSNATFSCKPGYTLSHIDTLTCTAAGDWNGSPPTCDITECARIDAPSQGFVSFTGNETTYGSNATFSCKPGYTLSHTDTLTCTAAVDWNGNPPTCYITDCARINAPSQGSVSFTNNATTYGSNATFSCKPGYTLSHTDTLTCTAAGDWNGAPPTCNIKDCGRLSAPVHGSVSFTNNVTTFQSNAEFTCNPGYVMSGGKALSCSANGSWNASEPSCTIKDCGNLTAPTDGTIDASEGTTFGATVRYTCSAGFKLYGDAALTCLVSGLWEGLPATCVQETQSVTPCPAQTDGRNTTWKETLPNQVRVEECQTGFTGSASRKCAELGRWDPPIYNCTREKVKNIKNKASALKITSTKTEVTSVLQDLTTLTSETSSDDVAESDTLTHEELKDVAGSFQDVTEVITADTIDEQVQENIFDTASSLIGSKNRETWTAIENSGGVGAEKVLQAIDKATESIVETFSASSETAKSIVKPNIVFEIQKVNDKDASFPDLSKSHTSLQGVATSSALLKKAALKGTNIVLSAVIFKNMSEITTAKQASSNDTKEINGPVIAITTSPSLGKLDPPLQLVIRHTVTGFDSPTCTYWDETVSQWSTTGCKTVFTNATVTVCECDHLTNFAVLMSPFVEADSDSVALRIVSIVGIGISIVCLILTLVIHFHLWRYLRSDRTTILMHLCVALLVSYVVFLAGVDRTESRVVCVIVAVLLQYLYLVVFCVMLAEGIEIGITVMFVFVKRSRIKPLMIAAWVLPAVIVGISLGVSKAEGYGNENFCWLSVDSGLIWAFVGPAAAIIVFNLIILLIVIKVMFSTKAMEQKKKLKKLKTGIRSLCVLIPLMGTTWIIGIFYINEDFYWIQYIFAICNGLQGFFIFLFHCILNPQITTARAAQTRRKSSTNFKSTMRTTVKSGSKITKDPYSNDMSNTYLGKSHTSEGDEEDKNNYGSTAQKYLHNGESGDDRDRPTPMGNSNGLNVRLNTASYTSI